MAEKKTAGKATKIKENSNSIIFKANRPLSKEEFELLSDLTKLEENKTGIKIILMPYSCEVVEDVE